MSSPTTVAPTPALPTNHPPFSGTELAVVVRHQAHQIEDLLGDLFAARAQLAEDRRVTAKLDLHRESISLMAYNLNSMSRIHWIRRRRILAQLSNIVISLAGQE